MQFIVIPVCESLLFTHLDREIYSNSCGGGFILIQMEADPLPIIHRRSDVGGVITTDQGYQQSADKRLHLKRKILLKCMALVGADSVHREAQRSIHEKCFMQCVIPDPGYF